MPRQKWRGISIFGMTNPFEPPVKAALDDELLALALAEAQESGGAEAAMKLLEEQSILRAADATAYLNWVREMESLASEEAKAALTRVRIVNTGLDLQPEQALETQQANDEAWKALVPNWQERAEKLEVAKEEAIAEAISNVQKQNEKEIEAAVAQALETAKREAELEIERAVAEAKAQADDLERERVAAAIEVARLEAEAKLAHEQTLLEEARLEALRLQEQLEEERRAQELLEFQERARQEAQIREQQEAQALAEAELVIAEEVEKANRMAEELTLAAEQEAASLENQRAVEFIESAEPEPNPAAGFATGSFDIIESAEQAATEEFDQEFEMLLEDGELPFAREPQSSADSLVLSTIDRRSKPVSQLFVWSSLTTGIGALAFGYLTISLELTALDKMLALFLGLSLSALTIATAAIAGKRSGLSTLVLSRAAFGVKANMLPALIVVAAKFALGLSIIFATVGLFDGVVLGAPALTTSAFALGQLPVTWQVVIIVGLATVAAALAFFGGKILFLAQAITAGFSVLASLLFVVFALGQVNLEADELAFSTNWLGLIALSLTVAVVVGALWIASVAEFTRKISMSQSGRRLALFVILAILVIPMIIGAVSIVSAQSMSALFTDGAALRPVTFLLGATPSWLSSSIIVSAILTTLIAMAAWLYSSSVSLAALHIKVKAAVSQPLLLVAVTLGALGLSVLPADLPWMPIVLQVCGVLIFAWAGVFVADVALRRIAYHEISLVREYGFYRSANLANTTGFILSVVIGLGFIEGQPGMFSWLGYFGNLLQLSEINSAGTGVLFALLLGALFPPLFTRGRIREQEREVKAIEARRKELIDVTLAEDF